MKRCFMCLLALAVLLSLGTVTAFAEPESEEPVPREPGWCGEAVQWRYADGVLTLEGSGRTDDFYAGQPWQDFRAEIRTLQLRGQITYLGAYAFPDYDALETVELGESLTEIGQAAFSGCDGLGEVSLPRSFRIFGEESFSHCKNLKEFHFEGGFPKFKLNCMWDTYAKLIYPAARPWPLQHIMELEEAFQGRIEFIASDGTDPYVPEAEVPAETEAPAPTAAPATEPSATQPPVVRPPVTEPLVTEAPTQATVPTRPAVTVPPTTEEEYVIPPVPEQPVPPEEEGFPLAALIGIMAVSGLCALLLIGRMCSRRRDRVQELSEILLEDERKARKPSGKSRTGSTGKTSRKTSGKGGKYRK